MAKVSRILISLACLFLAACSPQTYPPVSLTDAITDIADNLSKFHTLELLGVSQWSSAQVSVFEDGLRVEQCRQKTADPIIVTLRDSILMKLTGQISATGSFTVGSSGMGLPSLSASGSKSAGHVQELDVPVYLTPLSALADYTYLRRADQYKPIWNEVDSLRNETYGKEIQESHVTLKAIIVSVIADYPNIICAKKIADNPDVFFGAKKKQ